MGLDDVRGGGFHELVLGHCGHAVLGRKGGREREVERNERVVRRRRGFGGRRGRRRRSEVLVASLVESLMERGAKVGVVLQVRLREVSRQGRDVGLVVNHVLEVRIRVEVEKVEQVPAVILVDEEQVVGGRGGRGRGRGRGRSRRRGVEREGCYDQRGERRRRRRRR